MLKLTHYRGMLKLTHYRGSCHDLRLLAAARELGGATRPFSGDPRVESGVRGGRKGKYDDSQMLSWKDEERFAVGNSTFRILPGEGWFLPGEGWLGGDAL